MPHKFEIAIPLPTNAVASPVRSHIFICCLCGLSLVRPKKHSAVNDGNSCLNDCACSRARSIVETNTTTELSLPLALRPVKKLPACLLISVDLPKPVDDFMAVQPLFGMMFI